MLARNRLKTLNTHLAVNFEMLNEVTISVGKATKQRNLITQEEMKCELEENKSTEMETKLKGVQGPTEHSM